MGRAGGDKIKGDPEGVFNEATEMPPPLPGTIRLLSLLDDKLALLGVDIIAVVEALWECRPPLCHVSLCFDHF